MKTQEAKAAVEVFQMVRTQAYNGTDYEPCEDEYLPSLNSQGILGIETYMRQELPRRVFTAARERISQMRGPLEEFLLLSLPDIVRDTQELLFREYRDRTGGQDFGEMPFYSPTAFAAEPLSSRPGQGHDEESGQYENRIPLANPRKEIPDRLPDLVGESLNLGLQNGEGLDFDRQSGPQNNTNAFSMYTGSEQNSCGCSDPCSCFGTTISSQSYGTDGVDFDIFGRVDERAEEIFQFPQWASDKPWNLSYQSQGDTS